MFFLLDGFLLEWDELIGLMVAPLATQESVGADAARELAMHASNDAHLQKDEA